MRVEPSTVQSSMVETMKMRSISRVVHHHGSDLELDINSIFLIAKMTRMKKKYASFSLAPNWILILVVYTHVELFQNKKGPFVVATLGGLCLAVDVLRLM